MSEQHFNFMSRGHDHWPYHLQLQLLWELVGSLCIAVSNKVVGNYVMLLTQDILQVQVSHIHKKDLYLLKISNFNYWYVAKLWQVL